MGPESGAKDYRLTSLKLRAKINPSSLKLLSQVFCHRNKKGLTRMFIAALFMVVKIWNYPKCPSTEEWVKKM
jgi:hypothetical protein